ncbi:MAG: effector-associated domain EAD1-containing protein [Leptolyngbyaceae cyanobacterium CAN_BIN12]|nr:effector-associated domain EAD1-containing protein [Leptolyngbyaceae cyanobacterium CAN_BIN12]
MLNLFGEDLKQLRGAVESAYPKPDDLERFIDEELNTNLALISTGSSHSAVVFDPGVG